MPKGDIVGNNGNEVVIMEIRVWGLIKCWSNGKAKKVMSRRPKEKKPIYEDQEPQNIWHEQNGVVAWYLSRERRMQQKSKVLV